MTSWIQRHLSLGMRRSTRYPEHPPDETFNCATPRKMKHPQAHRSVTLLHVQRRPRRQNEKKQTGILRFPWIPWGVHRQLTWNRICEWSWRLGSPSHDMIMATQGMPAVFGRAAWSYQIDCLQLQNGRAPTWHHPRSHPYDFFLRSLGNPRESLGIP